MAKKNKNFKTQTPQEVSHDNPTLRDQLSSDVLAKLQATKKTLVEKEQAAEEERQAKLAFERKQREKNMSFEELLDKYGDAGSKF